MLGQVEVVPPTRWGRVTGVVVVCAIGVGIAYARQSTEGHTWLDATYDMAAAMSDAVGTPLVDAKLVRSNDGDLEEWYFLSAGVKSTGEIGTWVTPGFGREILDPRQVTRYDINNYVHLTTPADPVAKALNTTGLFDQRIDYPTGDLMNIDGAQASRACVTDAHN